MTFGEMLIWTNRLNEIINIKNKVLQVQRARNLLNDFLTLYDDKLSFPGSGVKFRLYLSIDELVV